MLGKLFGMFILMLANFLAALYLETRLAAESGAESIAIIAGLVLAIGVLYGLFARARWTWQLSTIFFSASLGNMSLLYYFGNRLGILVLLVYLAGIFFGFIGLMISLLSIETSAPEPAAEPVQEEVPAGTSYVWPKEKKAKAGRRAGRKAAGRKRAGRRRK